MTAPAPQCHDPASDVIDVFLTAMRDAFNPDSECPPAAGGSTVVRMFAGDGALPAWSPGDGCEGPFLWVRAANRYRSRLSEFPTAYVGDRGCRDADVTRVLAVEVGVGRCTSMELETDWDALAAEAEVSLEDSWRIERVLCTAGGRLRKAGHAVATDTVAPYGPAGGIVAWTGLAYAQF